MARLNILRYPDARLHRVAAPVTVFDESLKELVERAERVKVRAYDQNGNPFTLEAQGLLSVCIQHEMDHLKGKVFVEYLSQLKQQRIRAKLAKQLRKTA